MTEREDSCIAGSKIGGRKAAQKNREKYDQEYLAKHGMTFYQYLGQKGGANGKTGGFASNIVGPDGLTGRQRASVVGALGGRKSRRGR